MTLRAVLVAAMLAVPVVPVHAEQTQPAVDKNDPSYVRCRKIAVTGSLVKKERICRTNAEWKRLSDRGSDAAQMMLERNVKGSSTYGN